MFLEESVIAREPFSFPEDDSGMLAVGGMNGDSDVMIFFKTRIQCSIIVNEVKVRNKTNLYAIRGAGFLLFQLLDGGKQLIVSIF